MTEFVTPDSALLAAPRATAIQCIRFMQSRPHGEYTPADAETIVGGYFEWGARGGFDPLLAIAQLIHETGNLTSWWAQRPRRNPAGIGVTGRTRVERPAFGAWQWNAQRALWCEGVAFASWRDEAIPAHVGRLLAYALKDANALEFQRVFIRRALMVRLLPQSHRGSAPTLRGLEGRWAVPGTGYADKIAQIANAIRGM